MLELPSTLTARGLTLRPITSLDASFLRALYATARTDAAMLATLPPSQREPFLADQFRLQDIHYRKYYEGADFMVIEHHRKPAGRLILDRRTREWAIVDIALLPALRGQGIGRALLQAVLDSAVEAGAAHVNLQVEPSNRAAALYERLGFVKTGGSGMRVAMVWTAVS